MLRVILRVSKEKTENKSIHFHSKSGVTLASHKRPRDEQNFEYEAEELVPKKLITGLSNIQPVMYMVSSNGSIPGPCITKKTEALLFFVFYCSNGIKKYLSVIYRLFKIRWPKIRRQ